MKLWGDPVMSQTTCIALSAVFPLILVTMAIEHRRALRFVRRREKFFERLVEYCTIGSLLGLVITVIGVQLDGLNFPATLIVWALFTISVFGLGVMLVAIIDQDRDDRADELRRERAAEEEQQRKSIEQARRDGVWWRRRLRS